MPVKRIDAFQIGDPGRRAVLFDPHQSHAPLPESLPARLQDAGIESDGASPIGNQAEIIKAGPATSWNNLRRVQIQEMQTANPGIRLSL